MGKPIKIVDLAENMIQLSGLKKNEIKIKYIGLKPDKKLYIKLFAINELTLPACQKK